MLANYTTKNKLCDRKLYSNCYTSYYYYNNQIQLHCPQVALSGNIISQQFLYNVQLLGPHQVHENVHDLLLSLVPHSVMKTLIQ